MSRHIVNFLLLKLSNLFYICGSISMGVICLRDYPWNPAVCCSKILRFWTWILSDATVLFEKYYTGRLNPYYIGVLVLPSLSPPKLLFFLIDRTNKTNQVLFNSLISRCYLRPLYLLWSYVGLSNFGTDGVCSLSADLYYT